MRKLFSANRFRLKRTKVFWFTLVFTFCFSIFSVLQGQKIDSLGNLGRDLDYYYAQPLPFFGLIISVFIAIFLGTDYSNGTIRNKLIVGYKRSDIYLANLLTCFSGVLVVIIAWLLGGLAGIPYFGLWSVGIPTFCEYVFIAIFSIMAIASILVLESQIISDKTISAVVGIFTALGLFLAGIYFYNALLEPETTPSNIIISSNGIEYGPEIANPAYIGGSLRKIYQAMLYIIPTGQAFLIAEKEVTKPFVMCICSLAVIAVSTLIGIILFGRKNIK